MNELRLAGGDTPCQARTVTVLENDLVDLIRIIAHNDEDNCIAVRPWLNPHEVPMCPALMRCDAERQRGERYKPFECERILSEHFGVCDAEQAARAKADTQEDAP